MKSRAVTLMLEVMTNAPLNILRLAGAHNDGRMECFDLEVIKAKADVRPMTRVHP
jgi:hypothetical protein